MAQGWGWFQQNWKDVEGALGREKDGDLIGSSEAPGLGIFREGAQNEAMERFLAPQHAFLMRLLYTF